MWKKTCDFLKTEKLVLITLAIYIFLMHMDVVALYEGVLQRLFHLAKYVCYAMFIFVIVRDWVMGSKITVPMVAMAVLATVISVATENLYLLKLLLVMFAIRKIEFDKLLKVAFLTTFFTFVGVMGLTLVRILPNWLFGTWDRERNSLGFCYSTMPSTYVTMLILMRFYLKKAGISVFEIIVHIECMVGVFILTDSRTGLVLTTVIIVAEIIAKIYTYKNTGVQRGIPKQLKYVIMYMPAIVLVALVIAMLLYGMSTPIGHGLDEAISGRLKYACQAVADYGIPVWGENIVWKGWGGFAYTNKDTMLLYNYVDIAYMQMMFNYGIVFLGVIVLAYMTVLKQQMKKKNYYLIFCLIMVLCWSVMEPGLIEIQTNCFFLLFAGLFNKMNIKIFSYAKVKKLLQKRKVRTGA